MTTIFGHFRDVVGNSSRATVTISSSTTRVGTIASGVITTESTTYPLIDGSLPDVEVDPGTTIIQVNGDSVKEKWTIDVPLEGQHDISSLIDQQVDYSPEAVSQATAAANAASTSRLAADAAALAAQESANDAQGYAEGVNNVMTNAAEAIRSIVEGDADRAEAARIAAELAQGEAEDSAESAGDSEGISTVAASTAVTAASEAEASKQSASQHSSDANQSRIDAEDAKVKAIQAKADAETARGSAQSSASGASQDRVLAEQAKADAIEARNDSAYHSGVAESAASSAEGYAASTQSSMDTVLDSLDDALDAASRAEAARDEFGLSANASTVAPGDGASVSVSGGGPAYVLNFLIPRGEKGDVGPQGTGLELSGRAATHGSLPGGLGPSDAGRAYIVDSDGLLYIWNGTQYPPSGQGLNLVGAKGDKGDRGDEGPRGDRGPKGDDGPQGDRGPKGDSGASSWSDITGKPSTFPPQTSTSDSSKAKPGNWRPSWGDVTGKPSNSPPVPHNHSIEDINSLESTLGSLVSKGEVGEEGVFVEFTDADGYPSSRNEEVSTHLSGLYSTLSVYSEALGEALQALDDKISKGLVGDEFVKLYEGTSDEISITVRDSLLVVFNDINELIQDMPTIGTGPSHVMAGDRIQTVTSLPSNPAANVLYLIPEDD